MAGERTRRRDSALETRRRLEREALRLFVSEGYEETSVEAICAAAAVTKGAFYAHFPSKDSLLASYVEALDDKYREFFRGLDPRKGAIPALLEFSALVADAMRILIGRRTLRALYRAEVSGRLPVDIFVSKDRELYRTLGGLVARGQAEGSLRRDLAPDLAAEHVVLAMRGILFEWCARGDAFDLKEGLASHVTMLLEGLRPRRDD